MDVVHIENLVKRYGDFVALDGVSLSIKQGEIVGLLGPNGSGKSTTINCLLQLLTYESGTIELFGEPMSPTAYGLKERIGVVPQEVAVFDELTVRQNVEYFCSLYVQDKNHRRELVDEALEYVGLTDFAKWRPAKLSGGLLRRLNIACGIAHKPDLAIFDEPTVAVDTQSRTAILDGIAAMNKAGTTVIYTSHYMEEVEELCERAAILDHGKIIADGTIADLKSQVNAPETVEVTLANLSDDKAASLVKRLQDLTSVRSAAWQKESSTVTLRCDNTGKNVVEILSVLQSCGLSPQRLWAEPPTLNDVFLELTGRELRD